MSKPTNFINKVKLPNNTTYEIIPEKLGDDNYIATVPTLTGDSTLALQEDVMNDYGYLSDFNTVPNPLVSGMYYYDANTTNRPDFLFNDKGIVYYIINKGADRFFQFAFSSFFTGKPYSAGMRCYRSNNWDDWVRIKTNSNTNAVLLLRTASDVSIPSSANVTLTDLRIQSNSNQYSFLTLGSDHTTITIGKQVSYIKITMISQFYQNSAETRFVNIIYKNNDDSGNITGYISSASNYQFSRQQVVQEMTYSCTEGDTFTFAVKSENATSANPDTLRKSETKIIIEVLR